MLTSCGIVGKYCDSGNGWSRYGDRCFKLYRDSKNYGDSFRSCQNDGYALAKIDDLGLKNWISNIDPRFWVGLSDGETEGRYLYLDDTELSITR